MKNIKQHKFLGLAIIGILSFFLVCSFTETETKRITYISNDLKYIQKQIIDWTKLGYEVEAIVPQSITETVMFDSNYAASLGIHKLTKGDILLILKK